VRSLKPSVQYAFKVRGIDQAGNVGAFGAPVSVKATGYQQTSSALTYSSGWSPASGSSYWGSSARYSSSKYASVSVKTTARGFGWVSTYGPTRGSVKVYVDGVWITTVNLKKASTTYRVIAWSIGWPSSGTHTLMLKPVGGARVDVDGFVLIR
jgi:hypothetical protein